MFPRTLFARFAVNRTPALQGRQAPLPVALRFGMDARLKVCIRRLFMFDAVVFAGGGNRCYWQGGFYEAAAARLGLSPKLVVGASAGAFAAAYSLLEAGPATRARVIGACDPKLKNFDFAAWRAGKPLCPVGPMFCELLDQTINANAFRRLQDMTDWCGHRHRCLSIGEAALSSGAPAVWAGAGFPIRIRRGQLSERSAAVSRCIDGQQRRSAVHAGHERRGTACLRWRAR